VSVLTQQKILRSVGIILVTMLVLALAQGLFQFTRQLELHRGGLLLWVLFPIFAILSGAATRFMTGIWWAAILISGVAFTVVVLVLFDTTTLVFVPLYILLSLGGYATAGKFKKGNRQKQVKPD